MRRESFRLATGKLEGPPFSQADMDRLRREVAGTLDDPAGALEVPSGQPFFLHMLAQSLRVLGDPDWEILTQGEECYANGMPLGCEKPFPRAPQVFAPRSKYRKLDETPFDPCMINYTSAELSADQLEAQFREDERAGMMIATTEGAVKQEFGEGQLLIAAMGALVKPSGQIRPLHDGTHGIRLNNSIKVLDRLEHPGPADIVEIVAQAADAGEAPFCICADIAMAHRRAKVRRKDWPRLGCKARSDSKVIWLNCVGTFGVSSAAILWARLFGCVGRWVLRVLGPGFNLQVIFVDDLHVVVVGPGKFRTLWTIICAYLLVGTPFAFHKFKGGVAVEFVGFFLSYEKACAGVSEKRLAWIIEWIDKAEGAGWYVTGRRFSEFLGRLNFVGRLLTWLRPFLAPLFSFNAVLHRGTVARMPAMVHISLVYIRGELRKVGGLQTVKQMWLAPRESFRTDAKCERNRIVLGGWSLQNGLDPKRAKWFSLEVKPSELPLLFREDGQSSWASTSAEYLASFAAMAAFGHLDGPKAGVRDCVQVNVCGGTDNRSTPAVQKKGLSTKWPLFGFQMCAHSAMNEVNKRLVLNWRPREENSYADDLTNGVFSRFSPHLRVHLSLDQIPLGLLRKLAKAVDEFAEVKSALVTLKSREARMSRREKQDTKTPW